MQTGCQNLSTIKARADFLKAAQGGKWIAPALILQTTQRREGHMAGPQPRIGYTVTKKMGNAVKRNRIKRRLREAARRIAPGYARPAHDYVVIARLPALTCDFSDLLRDMEFAFSRIHAKKKPSS